MSNIFEWRIVWLGLRMLLSENWQLAYSFQLIVDNVDIDPETEANFKVILNIIIKFTDKEINFCLNCWTNEA